MTREEFERYQEEIFDSFCKMVIRNEAINAHSELATRARHEVALDDLGNQELFQLAQTDSYGFSSTRFTVRGEDIWVRDPELAEALRLLTPQRREVVLLSYFLGMSDTEISRVLHIDSDSVRYRRKIALKRLQELLEGLEHE